MRLLTLLLASIIFPVEVSKLAGQSSFIRGDSDEDGVLSMADTVLFLQSFLGERAVKLVCEDAADLNDTGQLDISDAIVGLGFLFLGTPPPRPPYPSCGPDPSEDTLSCARFIPCPEPMALPEYMVYGFGPFVRATFSNDGEKILLSTEDGIVACLDGHTGDTLHVYQGHCGFVNSVNFSKDDALAVASGIDQTARVWNVDTGDPVATFRHDSFVTSAVFSADADLVYTSVEAGTVEVWDVATGDHRQTFEFQSGFASASVNRIDLSPDGSLLLAVLAGTTHLIDTASGESRELNVTSTFVNDAAFLPSGQRIVVGGSPIEVWDVETGERLYRHRILSSFAVDPLDEEHVLGAFADRIQLVVLSVRGILFVEKEFLGHRAKVMAATISPDGSRAFSAGIDRLAILWDVDNVEILRKISGHASEVTSVAFSPSGNQVATASADFTARLWDASTGRLLRVFRGHTMPVTKVLFSSDGSTLLTASLDRSARLWDVHTGRTLEVYPDHEGWVLSAALSAGAGRVATGTATGMVYLWDRTTGRRAGQFQAHNLAVNDLGFSEDGQQMVTAGADRTAKLWSAEGELVGVLEGHSSFLTSARFSKQGDQVLTASGDGTARLWDIASREVVQVYEGHMDALGEARFSPDGDRVATIGGDATIRLFDTATGVQLRVWEGHDGWINGLSFSPCGTRLLTGGSDGTARLWPALP